MTGTAGQKRVPTGYLRDAVLPVPPREAQKRIVARIVDLFSEIDDGEAALARARTDLGTWRKALLKAAVTGELTADWRAANPSTEIGADLLARILDERRRRDNRKLNTSGLILDSSPDLPEGWAMTSIGAIFDVFVGSTPSRADKDLWKGDVPWISSGEVSFCRIASTHEPSLGRL